jgi:hypothetical protein
MFHSDFQDLIRFGEAGVSIVEITVQCGRAQHVKSLERL